MHTAATLLGGIGLFLLGLVLLTDGLKSFAGNALREGLMRFTSTPLKAFVSGVVVTAIMQSSSATTVTLIGFVSAGLLPFTHAVGVIFGASLGSTSTGWLISTLGLNVKLGSYALPLVGTGAFLRLLGRHKWKSLGLALAGFGMIFIGIATLQEGMQEASGAFDLATISGEGIRGKFATLGIGFVLTVLMQSSGAAVATVLTALHLGAVNFEEAALLAIGATVGTTVKGAIVAIGATVSAKRTALAHIVFNTLAGVIALLMLPPILQMLAWMQVKYGFEPGARSLTLFHSIFIGVGVLIFLPLSDRYAGLIERLLPDRGPRLTMHLDASLLSVPAVALEAVRRALCETARQTIADMRKIISETGQETTVQMQLLSDALTEIRDFLARIPPIVSDQALSGLHLAQVHGLDHLQRLQSRLDPADELRPMLTHHRLAQSVEITRSILSIAEEILDPQVESVELLERLHSKAEELAALRRDERAAIMRETAAGAWLASEALEVLDVNRRLDGVGYHTWRLCHYLAFADAPTAMESNGQNMRPEE